MFSQITWKAIGASLVTGAVLAAIASPTSTVLPISKAIAQPQLCKSPEQKFAKTELYFGSLKPTGSEVTAAEFARFLDHEVTPRFPDGLTLLNGFGEFKGANGKTIQETSRLVILIYPLTAESSQKVEQIRRAYKTRFEQESVLRVENELCVSF